MWDDRLASAGSAVAAARSALVDALQPIAAEAYGALAGAGRSSSTEHPLTPGFSVTYRQSWAGDLGSALRAARTDDVRRGVTTIGPHRDDLRLELAGRDARVQASQGEQRCVALGLRLAVHQLVTERSENAPILLLDDVFSELDPDRSRALLRRLPPGQTLLTTAVPLPPGVDVAAVVDVRATEQPSGKAVTAS